MLHRAVTSTNLTGVSSQLLLHWEAAGSPSSGSGSLKKGEKKEKPLRSRLVSTSPPFWSVGVPLFYSQRLTGCLRLLGQTEWLNRKRFIGQIRWYADESCRAVPMPGNEEAPTPHAGNLVRWLLLGGIGAGSGEWAAMKTSLWCFSIHRAPLADLAGHIFSKLELQTAVVMKLSQFIPIF